MLREENDALGSDFTTRGAYADESIEVMRDLWTSEDPSHSGRFFDYGGFKFSPKPVQSPGVPILIGGMSRAAMRRAARLGDGGHPNGGSVTEMGERFETVRTMCAEFDRDPDEVTLVVRGELEVLDTPSDNPSTPMIGTPDQLLRTIEGYESIGVSEIVLQVGTDDVDRIRRTQEAFAEQVLPRVG